MGLASLNFLEFVLNFGFQKLHHDDQGDDVDQKNQPRGGGPGIKHASTSNRWTNIDIHVSPGLTNAAEASALLHEEIIEAGRKHFGKGYFTENQTDHAGSAGARGAVGAVSYTHLTLPTIYSV